MELAGLDPTQLETLGNRLVTLIASAENVLSLSSDDRYVYAGQPWGLSVYDLSGTPVARVALGQAVHTIAPAGSFLGLRTDIESRSAAPWTDAILGEP